MTGALRQGDPGEKARETLRCGDLTVIGQIRSASNATFLCEASLADSTVHCVYKPVAGERPLWDFPDGTLAGREVGAYLISAAMGWNIVPHTIIREGPAGRGMVQQWIDEREAAAGERDLVDLFPAGKVPRGYLPVLRAYDYSGDEVTLAHADDPALRRMAVFDILVNNADRKGGHILTGLDGHVYGVDHGICLHVQDKLRTILWGWAGKPVESEVLRAVDSLVAQLTDGLAGQLREHVTRAEVAGVRRRALDLLENPVMPGPDRHRPIPWPAF